jgi:hypothetical protein
VSTVHDPAPDPQAIEQERQRLSRRLDEVARLCESDVPPGTFYGELLRRLLESLAATAGAVWGRTAQGNLQILFQINLKEVGLDRSEEARQAHFELLRRAVVKPQPLHLLPHSGAGPAEEGQPAPGNPTEYLLLLVPVLLNDQVAGLIEVWQSPGRPLNAVGGFLRYMGLMADLGARYQRNQMLGQMAGQQQLWTQLEAFSRQVHSSLNPVEVSYHVANEGRRLVACDRVSVAVRRGRKVTVEAISGADVVEKRSNLVLLMRKLSERVLQWGEKLVFTGTKDDSLPPKVLDALDAYLAESASKLLVIQPLKDEREGESTKPARAALVMECFDPPAEPQQLIARLDVVARHATSALYNSVEHRRIPMRFVWMPLATLQEGVGGKAKAITLAVALGLAALGGLLYALHWPLKMDATGQLLPQVRRVIYSPVPGTVMDFTVSPGDTVDEGRSLATLFDRDLEKEIWKLKIEEGNAHNMLMEADLQSKQALAANERQESRSKADQQRYLESSKAHQLNQLLAIANSDPQNPGYFFLKAPAFTAEDAGRLTRREWTVLNGNFKEELTNRAVKASDPILRLGAKNGPWELEVKIPQKHIGQVLQAFERLHRQGVQNPELDVDFLLRTDPTRKFKGKLSRDKIAGEANPNRDDNNESEPVVVAYVRLDDDTIDADHRVPPELLLSGTEVRVKIYCGNHRMGYSLFYGVWEFLYDKVVFFF